MWKYRPPKWEQKIFRACIATESATTTGIWQIFKSRQGSGKALYWKREGFRSALIAGCWHGEVGGGYLIGLGTIFSFLWLVLSWKQGQKLGKLLFIAQVLTVLGSLLQSLWFGFLGWLQSLWVRVLLSFVVWLLSLCVFSLSKGTVQDIHTGIIKPVFILKKPAVKEGRKNTVHRWLY